MTVKYELRRSRPGEKEMPVDVFDSRQAAEAGIPAYEASVRKVHGDPSGQDYRIHEIDTDRFWQMPAKRNLRAEYTQDREQKDTGPHTWDVNDIQILHWANATESRVVASYHRNYPGTPPFEPFRQGDRDYALISEHYTASSVVDLQTGKIIAAEKPDQWGFCPVGFYVPDWYDCHDGGIIPGSFFWDDRDDRWPDGTLGFVWGCVWGDDNGWKVQALDLSGVSEGRLTRDDRFGYVYLETNRKLNPQEFIQVSAGEGGSEPRVIFSVPRTYTVSGKLVYSGAEADA